MARRGLGKGLRAYFPDYQEENSHSELEHEVSEQDGSHGEDEHSVDRKAKLEELDMVLLEAPGKRKQIQTKRRRKKREQPQGRRQLERILRSPVRRAGRKQRRGKLQEPGRKKREPESSF